MIFTSSNCLPIHRTRITIPVSKGMSRDNQPLNNQAQMKQTQGQLKGYFQDASNIFLASSHEEVPGNVMALIFKLLKGILSAFSWLLWYLPKFTVVTVILKTLVDMPLEYIFSYQFGQNSPVILPTNPLLVLAGEVAVFPVSYFLLFLCSFRFIPVMRLLFMNKMMILGFITLHGIVFMNCLFNGVAYDFVYLRINDQTDYFVFSCIFSVVFGILYFIQPMLYAKYQIRGLNALNEPEGKVGETILGHNTLKTKIGGFLE